jgi:hypothetical protein
MTDPVATGTQANVQTTVNAVSAIVFQGQGEGGDAATYEGADPSTDAQGGEVTVQAHDEVEIVAHLENFTKAPGTAKFEVFADAPPDTGGTPVKTIKATKKSELVFIASWTYDPSDAQQKKLNGTAWVRATADAVSRVAQVTLRDPGVTKMRWDSDPAGAHPIELARPDQSVKVSCHYNSHDPDTTPTIEVYGWGDIDLHGHAPKDGATALATLDVTDDTKKKTLTASWTAALPDSPSDAPTPSPLPRVYFWVTIGDNSALSPPLGIVPDLQLAFEPGDPTAFMERVVPRTPPPGTGVFEDFEHVHDNGTPWRVLGIKQRLQALGYYYERLPAAPAHPDPDTDPRNRQTRVFRKCVKYYWEKVYPGRSPPMSDAGTYYPDGDLEAGPQIVTLDDATMDDWCQKLDDAVKAAFLTQDPPDPNGNLDLTQDSRIMLPGDLHYHFQENLPANAPVDYTYTRTDGPYSRYTGGYNNPPSQSEPDFRFRMEDLHFRRNPALTKVPIAAKLQMKQKDGSWVDGPADGIRVLFQLVPVRDDPAPDASSFPPAPQYLDDLALRDGTRVTALRDVLSTGSSHAPATGGPRSYVKGVHEHFFDRSPSPDADPTWWNAPPREGGKRGGGKKAAGDILLFGRDAAALGVIQTERFPWQAEDASVPHPAHGAHHARTVAVSVANARAVGVLSPSRLGGEAYKVRVFVDSPAPPAANQDPDVVVEKTTGALTVWRRLRITRYFQKAIPSTWDQQAIDEAGGTLGDIDWDRVAAIYKKAFFVLEKPPDGVTTLTMDLRDKAAQGAVQLIQAICPVGSGATTPTNYAPLMRRYQSNATLPKFDLAQLIRQGIDTPYLIDFKSPRDYDKDIQGRAGVQTAGAWPFGRLFRTDDDNWTRPGLLNSIFEELLTAFTLFLDDGYDPNANPQTYDAVPFPGLTCVQALYADSYTPFVESEIIYSAGTSSIVDVIHGTQEPDGTKDLATQFAGLTAGGKVSVLRYRQQDVKTARAKVAWANNYFTPPFLLEPAAVTPPTPPESRVPIWKRLDFVYGTDGKTVADLFNFIRSNVSQLARDPNNNDLEFQAFADITHGGGRNHCVFRKKDIFYDPWIGDGLVVDLGYDGTSGFQSFGLMQVSDDRNSQNNSPGAYASSGLACKTRTITVFYGTQEYDNSGTRGALSPTTPGVVAGTTPRGYNLPGRLFCYDLSNNAAHELGHTLYLRHHWTGNPFNVAPSDHDHNDICVMSYYSSFVDLGGIQYSVPQADILAGTNRDKGRAEPCGRCLMKLRGWNASHDASHLTANHSASSTAPPTATPSNYTDW